MTLTWQNLRKEATKLGINIYGKNRGQLEAELAEKQPAETTGLMTGMAIAEGEAISPTLDVAEDMAEKNVEELVYMNMTTSMPPAHTGDIVDNSVEVDVISGTVEAPITMSTVDQSGMVMSVGTDSAEVDQLNSICDDLYGKILDGGLRRHLKDLKLNASTLLKEHSLKSLLENLKGMFPDGDDKAKVQAIIVTL